tara:strand:- start:129 stop:1913 length:1785 start_codon:yes stop_codon:yes gene_type:complete
MLKFIYPFLFVIFISCGDQKPKNEVTEIEKPTISAFETFKIEFIEALWKANPVWASYEGFHKYDSVLTIPNETNRKANLQFSEDWLSRLNSFEIDSLESLDLIDYRLIENYLKSIPFYQNELKAWQWNPSDYNLGGAFFQVINFKENKLEDRLKAISFKLDGVKAYYQAAQANINNPTRVHTELAISQLEGSKSIFSETLLDSLKKAKLATDFSTDFLGKLEAAIAAIDQYKTFLQAEILPDLAENDQRFRIGKELFEKKFQYEIQSGFSAEEIFKIAVSEKEILHDRMYQLAGMLWEKYFGEQEPPGNTLGKIKMVIDEVSKNHVQRDSFVVAIKNQIPALEKFVIEKDLITLDPSKPLIVRETPKYMRGVAGASISAPGPYDKAAETFYNVTPLDDYTDEEAESYLREYNNYTLQILNIHEAIPGHYTQLIYSNESPSIIKSILGNGAMVEGWAVYTEKMMLENEYGEDMELGLMYYKWNLRTVCNTILDYGVHVLNYSEEDAMQLLQKEAFQEVSEAKGKWKRARLSQVQLCSYFTGYHEIRTLRDELQELKGENFNLKSFHETFLSYGSAPVKHIRHLMLDQAKNHKPVS